MIRDQDWYRFQHSKQWNSMSLSGWNSNEEKQPVQSPIALIDMSSSWTITSESDFRNVSTVMLLTTVLPIVMQRRQSLQRKQVRGVLWISTKARSKSSSSLVDWGWWNLIGIFQWWMIFPCILCSRWKDMSKFLQECKNVRFLAWNFDPKEF